MFYKDVYHDFYETFICRNSLKLGRNPSIGIWENLMKALTGMQTNLYVPSLNNSASKSVNTFSANVYFALICGGWQYKKEGFPNAK